MVNPADLLKSLANVRDGSGKLPPVHLWNPPLCDNVQMRIDREGRWYYMDSPIGRQAMVRLFSTVLRLDEDGCHYLVTPVEKIRVLVADSPFVVVGWESTGEGADRIVSFRTNVGERFLLDDEHPLRIDSRENGEPAPHVPVRNNLEALLTRSVFYQIVGTALSEFDRRSDNPEKSLSEFDRRSDNPEKAPDEQDATQNHPGLYSCGRFFSLQPHPDPAQNLKEPRE